VHDAGRNTQVYFPASQVLIISLSCKRIESGVDLFRCHYPMTKYSEKNTYDDDDDNNNNNNNNNVYDKNPNTDRCV
jgi:hypothetical protein